MKFRNIFFGALGLCLASLALAGGQAHYPRYRLVVMGGLGGPNTYIDCCGIQPVINDFGLMVGTAETADPNPNVDLGPNETYLCGSSDAVVNPAVLWVGGKPHNLGALPGGYNSFATGVTDAGLIIGTSESAGFDPLVGEPECRAVLWWKGKIVDLGTLGGYVGIALQANLRGQVVGVATNSIPDSLPPMVLTAGVPFALGAQPHAFLWERGVMRDLGTLGGSHSQALFINDRGDVAGASYIDSTIQDATGVPTQHPFLWRNGQMIDLGTLGGTLGYPAGLNARSDVVGVMDLAGDEHWHAFLWRAGSTVDLGTLGGNNSEAWAVNGAGTVVGRADITGSSTHHAFLWKQGRMIDLGVLAGQTCSTAFGINRREQVIGDTAVCSAGGVAEGPPFYAEPGLPMVSLESLLVEPPSITLVDADNINERGEISCQGFDADGNLHSCLMVPIDRR
jgi:probable HAF family extracellular repeat protein